MGRAIEEGALDLPTLRTRCRTLLAFIKPSLTMSEPSPLLFFFFDPFLPILSDNDLESIPATPLKAVSLSLVLPDGSTSDSLDVTARERGRLSDFPSIKFLVLSRILPFSSSGLGSCVIFPFPSQLPSPAPPVADACVGVMISSRLGPSIGYLTNASPNSSIIIFAINSCPRRLQ